MIEECERRNNMTTYEMTRLTLITFMIFCIVPIASAQQTSPPKEARVIGIIDLNAPSQNVIETPKSIKAGKDFEVKIFTSGSGCEREGETSVILHETSASIFVFDYTTATHPGVACTMVLKRLLHTTTVNFKKPGEAVIRLWGRRIGSDTPPGGEPMILEKKITVE
jgi:hypothetical protein